MTNDERPGRMIWTPSQLWGALRQEEKRCDEARQVAAELYQRCDPDYTLAEKHPWLLGMQPKNQANNAGLKGGQGRLKL